MAHMSGTPTTPSDTRSQYEFQQRWDDALQFCKAELGPDYALIREYRTPAELAHAIEKMQNDAQKSSIPRLLRQFKPKILQLQAVTFGLTVTVGSSSLQTACLWGLVTVMLEFAIRSDDLLSQIIDMWAEISNSLLVFEVWKDFIKRDVTLQDIVFEILVELLLFAAFTIKAIKYVRTGTYNPLAQITTCKMRFKETSEKVSRGIKSIKDKIEAQRFTERLPESDFIKYLNLQDNISSKISKDETISSADGETERRVKLPCYYAPFPANPDFYGRKNEIASIEKLLISAPASNSGKIHSVALWGTAGMGKTQIALEYADRQRKKGTRVVLWIASEDVSSSAKAFTEIANLLEIPGASDATGHNQNRLLVLRWLQSTECPWLIVFDNVEDQRLLRSLRPSHGCGSILITCRSELAAASSAQHSIEVPAFSKAEGSALLLQELRIKDSSPEDIELSVTLAEEWGGHALTIDVMARNMRARKKNLHDFFEDYSNDPRSLHKKPRRGIENMYYDRPEDLETLWKIAFDQLQDLENKMFGILCMLGPNDIPAKIFFGVIQIEWLADIKSSEVEDITNVFVDLALARATAGMQYISVHRLIQSEFRAYLSREIQEVRWREAAIALHNLFPQQRKGFALFNEWKLCESLIEHVQLLAERYLALDESQELPYLEDFIFLISDASRYLIEIGRYTACDHLLRSGFRHCKNTRSIPYTNLCVHMGTASCERGRDMRALKYNDIVLAVRKDLLPPTHSEIANALSNSALSMVGCGAHLHKALDMLLQSLKIDLANPASDHKRVLHLRHFNISFAYRALGKMQEAREHVNQASAYARTEFGQDSRYLTISYRMYADFDIRNAKQSADPAIRTAKYKTAFQWAEESYRIAKAASATSPWVSSALYYMGRIKLLQGETNEAITYLESALAIAEINQKEKGDAGEVARTQRQLSDAYTSSGNENIGTDIKGKAETTYESLIETEEYTRSAVEPDKWDYLICLKFR